MTREEAFAWLRNIAGISEPRAQEMLTQAVNFGSSATVRGVWVTYDGQMFNNYDDRA